MNPAFLVYIVFLLKIEEFQIFYYLIIALAVLWFLELKVGRHVSPHRLNEIINCRFQWLESF